MHVDLCKKYIRYLDEKNRFRIFLRFCLFGLINVKVVKISIFKGLSLTDSLGYLRYANVKANLAKGSFILEKIGLRKKNTGSI